MIRASAGSGKTYQLASRYLALLVLGVKPERVIALTFTKKAAGEFADRILTSLAEGAASEDGAEALAGNVKLMVYGAENMTPLVSGEVKLPRMDMAFFQSLLEDVVGSLDKLALSTLDSFFVKLLYNFAYELGMAGFELLEGNDLEVEQMRVFAEIFSHQTVSEKQRKHFMQAYQLATAGNQSIKLNDTLKEFLKQHQVRWLKNSDARGWGNETKLWEKEIPWKKVKSHRETSQRVRDLLEDASFTDQYKGWWENACQWVLLREGKAGLPFEGAGAKVKFGFENLDDLLSGKAIDLNRKKEIIIEGELAEAIGEMISGVVAEEIEARLQRTQGVYQVLRAYEERYESQVRGQGRLGFADATLLLAGEASSGMWDEVGKELVEYRIDGKYDHWMLDEFQDTSRAQWKVVENLIDEVVHDVEDERSLFVVGDTKQGIYGWRGGEPKLFDSLNERYEGSISQMPMDKSYRSAQEVLDLVNAVCDPRGKAMELFPKGAVERWSFHPHTAAKEIKGHAWVCEAEKVEDQTFDETKMQWIGGLLEKIQPVSRGLSCAILVRKNSSAREIAEYLRNYHSDMPVAVEDELLVGEENPVTAVLVDAFRFLCYPNDTLAWWHIQMSPFKAIFNKGEEANARKLWYSWTRAIAEVGVEQVLKQWVEGLRNELDLSRYSIKRLAEVEQAAEKFASKGGALSDWLLEIENWSQREVTREGVVQIMTVHKSKGLGFDVVILPELGGDAYDDGKRFKVIESQSDDGEVEHVLLPPVKDVVSADAVLSAEYERWQVEQCYEAFCVFYVMLTRAVYGTYCLLEAKKETKKAIEPKRNSADWLREAFTDSGREEQLGELNGQVLGEFGNWDWLDDFEILPQTNVVERENLTLPAVEAKPVKAKICNEKKQDFAKMLMKSADMEFGTQVHACFESVEWWNGELEWDKNKKIASLVTECLDEPSITPYFTKKDGLRVFREQSVESIIEGIWVSGVIDRLLLDCDDNGMVQNAVVLDMKTDSVEDGAELVERYSAQLERYRQMIMDIYQLPKEKVYCVFLSTHLKKTINL